MSIPGRHASFGRTKPLTSVPKTQFPDGRRKQTRQDRLRRRLHPQPAGIRMDQSSEPTVRQAIDCQLRICRQTTGPEHRRHRVGLDRPGPRSTGAVIVRHDRHEMEGLLRRQCGGVSEGHRPQDVVQQRVGIVRYSLTHVFSSLTARGEALLMRSSGPLTRCGGCFRPSQQVCVEAVTTLVGTP